MMRAVIEHGLDRGALPVKLCYAGPFFRYERPQAGRLPATAAGRHRGDRCRRPGAGRRGDRDRRRRLPRPGLDGFRLEITSLGDDTCRPQYRRTAAGVPLRSRPRRGRRRRAELNPLRVLDDKRPHMRELTADAPSWSTTSPTSPRHTSRRCWRTLDALRVPYVVNPRMVRGLDYYTKTTFEFVHDGLGAQSGIGGGGRYDGLMRELGDRTSPASGSASGSTAPCWRCTPRARRRATPPAARSSRCRSASRPNSSWPAGRRAAGRRRAGRPRLRRPGAEGAMRAADRSGARVALVAGDRDVEAGTVGVRICPPASRSTSRPTRCSPRSSRGSPSRFARRGRNPR